MKFSYAGRTMSKKKRTPKKNTATRRRRLATKIKARK